MSATIVVLAVCAVISFAGTIMSAFRDKVSTREVAYYPSDGYTDYKSSSAVIRNKVASSKGQKYLTKWIKDINKLIPNLQEDDYYKIISFLERTITFESYDLDELSRTINFIDYSNETGNMYFFILYITPDEKEDKFTFESINFACKLKIGSSFRIIETTAKNMFRTKSSQQLVETKGSISKQGMIDAISLGLAPVFTGDSGLTQEVVDVAIKSMRDQADAYKDDTPVTSSFK